MPEVVGVRFHGIGKAYDFSLDGLRVQAGDAVVVETNKGVQLGFCSDQGKFRDPAHVFGELRPVLRLADDKDLAQYEQNREDDKEAFRICRDKIEEFGLEMNLVEAEYTLDRQRLLFYFTADDRVDFRSFVRELASIFRCRIELRQIGVRDEAKMSGGVGICGREFCCAGWLDDFVPVSVRMAKTQNLSMNPTKISGSCGRLMCCLKFEQEQYVDARREAPRQGSTVSSPRGRATVVDVNLLTEAVTVRLDGDDEEDFYLYQFDELDYARPKKKQAPVQEEQSACKKKSCADGCSKQSKNLSDDDETVMVAGHPGVGEKKEKSRPFERKTRRVGKPAKAGFIPHMISPEDLDI